MRFKEYGMNMAFQMVDGHERLAQFSGQNPAIRHTHQQRTDQAGALRHAHGVDVCKIEARLEKSLADDRNDLAQMLSRCKFGNNSAVFAVNVELRGDDA